MTGWVPAARPFVDRPVASLRVAAAAARAAARTWRLPEPELVRSGMTAIFAAGDVILRVARPTGPATAGLELATVLAAAGVRVARPVRPEVVDHDGQSVTAWERLRPVASSPAWRAVGAMVARVHRLDPADLPPAYPLPPASALPWWQFGPLLAEVADLLDDPARAGLETAIARHEWWAQRPGDVVCHGDVHPGNVMTVADGDVLIDWDLMCTAPAGWDHAMLLRLERWGGSADVYAEFAAGYGRNLAGDDVTVAIAELRLVAATLMRLRAGRTDPAAMVEALRRLAYWRRDDDAPPWTAA
ncbi:MAG: phosphotransferase [Actinomycetota bacterium]|nr:phosphotransferase [Actinomycetota bacterium]